MVGMTTTEPLEIAVDVAAPMVAQVAVDTPLLHLDRPFDYVIPEQLPGADDAGEVVPGTRVKVRFAGRERDGWVLGVRAWTSNSTPAARSPRCVG